MGPQGAGTGHSDLRDHGEGSQEASREDLSPGGMELYLSACSKTANVAANKAASSTVAEDSQQCVDVSGVASGWCGCPGLRLQ